ncbi:MAG TPA: serine/threonine protein kinase [Erwinia persicina]|uniref:Serine/threonine protein kinase n=1 Tax=Erwinia persicina TaxID=55211 RepID=A0A4U3FM97_9GAMM|nr:serine/threonine-protein kinase [Erwinia persicina]MBC3944340.1 serine/threonine protein kinase [Erwinia persicina]MBD8105365.1 serine/threonine protein kinase [Erwinia persicina]MBD8165963.1 serine/threonine protein kinase [Erwinia persicina]MBD8208511.1 serine/threonine protein kinase [Erwinia persicina]MCQ4092166.1 serine/threonine protein kinase [Erwinia persicina]
MSANDQQKNVPNALPAGYRFNEFEIKEVIGGGGFGIVYRAWDHLLERTIAIKEYLPVSLASRNEDLAISLRGERYQRLFNAGLNSFIQEARLLARFNHPGLLHVLRFWEENGTAYMGTLFYSGMTLKAWQQTSPESINEAWIRQLLPPLFGAINTIHRAGYLHRDISLDNIQIQDNQLPVLLDFGSARKEIGNLSDEMEIMLKPGYAPIEQYSEEGDSDQGPWTDIYALGAVLHTLITGNPPPVSVVRCIEDRYQPLSTLRPEGYSLPLLHAIDRALEMDPRQRPQSVDELAALIDLPVSEIEELVASLDVAQEEQPALPDPEPVVLAVNPAAGAAEPVMAPRVAKRLSRPLLLLSGLAVAAVVALVWGLNHEDSAVPEHSAAASNSTATPSPAVPPASAPAMATVYLKLSSDDVLLLNGSVVEVKPNTSGYASLNLAAGDYQLEVQNASGVRSQQLKIDRPGTWLINPGR